MKILKTRVLVLSTLLAASLTASAAGINGSVAGVGVCISHRDSVFHAGCHSHRGRVKCCWPVAVARIVARPPHPPQQRAVPWSATDLLNRLLGCVWSICCSPHEEHADPNEDSQTVGTSGLLDICTPFSTIIDGRSLLVRQLWTNSGPLW